MNIQIERNDYVQPKEVRKDVVQCIIKENGVWWFDFWEDDHKINHLWLERKPDGSQFVLLLFTIGNVAIVRVYHGENYERLVYYNVQSYEKFRQAAEAFEDAKDRILDEQNNHWLHKRFAK